MKLTFWRLVAGVILAAGIAATWTRFTRGLGASTNLSDAFPWGLWIGFDVLVGVGLAAGGFVIAATVHIFRIEKYAPIARPALLTAFLGYLLVIVALLFDLGRPYRIWHPMIMWNPHSVMFEVAWCVTLYTTVLALEFSPLLFERLRWARPLRIVRSVFVPLVIVGVLLSTMHQSSLGTLYVIMPDKLYPLWYTPFLPIFFFMTAIAAGLAMTIFESFMSARAFGKKLEHDLLEGLGRVIVVVLAAYTVWKTADLAGRGQLHLVLRPAFESVLFWGEMGLGVLLPMLLFSLPAVRRSEQGLFFAAMLTVMGFVINRLNVSITGMEGWSQAHYFPSWMEIAVTMSIVTVGFILFGLATRHLPVFSEEHSPARSAARAEISSPAPILADSRTEPSLAPPSRARPAASGRVLVALWSLLAVGVIAAGYSSQRAPDGDTGPASPADSASGYRIDPTPVTLPADYVFPRSAKSPAPVTFSHEAHLDRANLECTSCHESLFRMHTPGMPLQGKPTPERLHLKLCGACHNGKEAFSLGEGCERCHAK